MGPINRKRTAEPWLCRPPMIVFFRRGAPGNDLLWGDYWALHSSKVMGEPFSSMPFHSISAGKVV